METSLRLPATRSLSRKLMASVQVVPALSMPLFSPPGRRSVRLVPAHPASADCVRCEFRFLHAVAGSLRAGRRAPRPLDVVVQVPLSRKRVTASNCRSCRSPCRTTGVPGLQGSDPSGCRRRPLAEARLLERIRDVRGEPSTAAHRPMKRIKEKGWKTVRGSRASRKSARAVFHPAVTDRVTREGDLPESESARHHAVHEGSAS